MQIKEYLALILIIGVMGAAVFLNPSTANQDHGTIYQVSTYSSLASGGYDGNITIEEVKKHGNTGIGTINGLYGEMIVLDGVFYQIRSDATVHIVKDTEQTPFTMVTFYTPDKLLILNETMDLEQFESKLDGFLPSDKMYYTIVVKGEFKDLTTRSVPKQTKPYPPLLDAVSNQSVFNLHDVNGTMVGFWYPESAGSVNTPGYHFHFISIDRSVGGHVLDFELEKAAVGIDYISKLELT